MELKNKGVINTITDIKKLYMSPIKRFGSGENIVFYRILDINTSRGVFKIKFESKHKYDLIFPASNNSNQQIEKTDSKKIERFFK